MPTYYTLNYASIFDGGLIPNQKWLEQQLTTGNLGKFQGSHTAYKEHAYMYTKEIFGSINGNINFYEYKVLQF